LHKGTVSRMHKRYVQPALTFRITYVFGEDEMGIRKGTMDATGMLEATSEQTLDKDEDLRSCCIEWKKEFYHVNWTKLMQILKETGLDSHEGRLISKPYVDQCVKI